MVLFYFEIMYRLLRKAVKETETWLLRPTIDNDTPIADIDWFNATDEERNKIEALIAAAPDLYEALQEAKLQIEYLHEKFASTGTGNAVLSKIEAALAKADGVKTETI